MKYIALILISVYQLLFSIIAKQLFGIPAFCRYRPTCSQYMTQMIEKYGVMKGGMMGVKRLLSCHPFARYANI